MFYHVKIACYQGSPLRHEKERGDGIIFCCHYVSLSRAEEGCEKRERTKRDESSPCGSLATEVISFARRCEEREEEKQRRRKRMWERERERKRKKGRRETPLATEKFPSRERGALEREERERNNFWKRGRLFLLPLLVMEFPLRERERESKGRERKGGRGRERRERREEEKEKSERKKSPSLLACARGREGEKEERLGERMESRKRRRIEERKRS